MTTSMYSNSTEWDMKIVNHLEESSAQRDCIAADDSMNIATIFARNMKTGYTYCVQVPHLTEKEHPIYGSNVGLPMLETLIETGDYFVTPAQSTSDEYITITFDTYIGACGRQLCDNIKFIAQRV